MEHEVGGGAGDVEGLEIALAERDLTDGDREDEGRTAPQRPLGPLRLRPALALPRVEGLAHPVRRALGPDLQHERVPEAAAQRRVEAVGEAEVAADADPAGGAAGPGQLGGDPRIPRQPAGDADGAAGPGPGEERHPRRDDGRREDEEDGRGRRGHRGQRAHQPRGRDPSPAARRDPHLRQAPQAEAGPGHDVEAEAEVDGLGGPRRHQARRCTEREQQVAAGRARGWSGRPAPQTRRTVSGFTIVVMSAVDEVTEWKNQANAARRTDGHHDHGPPGWTGAGAVGEDHAQRDEHHGHDGRRQRQLVLGGTGGDGHEDRTQAGGPEPDGVLRGARPVRPPDRLEHPHEAPHRPAAGVGPSPRATARASRRPALRRSATVASTGPAGSTVPRRTGVPAIEQLHDRAEGAFGHALGLVEFLGQLHRHGDRLGRGSLELSHHQLAGMGGRPPMHVAPVVTRRVRSCTPRVARIGPGTIDDLAGLLARARARSFRSSAPGRHVQLGRERRAAPAGSTIAGRTEPPRRCRA